MDPDSLSDFVMRFLYTSISVFIVTAICVYKYLSNPPKKRSALLKDDGKNIDGSGKDIDGNVRSDENLSTEGESEVKNASQVTSPNSEATKQEFKSEENSKSELTHEKRFYDENSVVRDICNNESISEEALSNESSIFQTSFETSNFESESKAIEDSGNAESSVSDSESSPLKFVFKHEKTNDDSNDEKHSVLDESTPFKADSHNQKLEDSEETKVHIYGDIISEKIIEDSIDEKPFVCNNGSLSSGISTENQVVEDSGEESEICDRKSASEDTPIKNILNESLKAAFEKRLASQVSPDHKDYKEPIRKDSVSEGVASKDISDESLSGKKSGLSDILNESPLFKILAERRRLEEELEKEKEKEKESNLDPPNETVAERKLSKGSAVNFLNESPLFRILADRRKMEEDLEEENQKLVNSERGKNSPASLMTGFPVVNRDTLTVTSAGNEGVTESSSRRRSRDGAPGTVSAAYTPSVESPSPKAIRKSMPELSRIDLARFKMPIPTGVDVYGPDDVEDSATESMSPTSEKENDEISMKPSEIFQQELKSRANQRLTRANQRLTEKNRNILAARVNNRLSLNEDFFRMIPDPITNEEFFKAIPETTKPLAPIQVKIKETQELLSKQLRQHVKPRSTSPTSEIVNGVNGSSNGSGNGNGGLADRLGKLETAAQGWKKRVEPTDAVQFSVAGRMKAGGTTPSVESSLIPAASSPNLERKKKVPKPTRFKSKTGVGGNDSSESDESGHHSTAPTVDSKKTLSAVNGDFGIVKKESKQQDLPKIEVPTTFDDSFSLFFSAVPMVESTSSIDLQSDFNLDDLKLDPSLPKLVHRRTTKAQQRREASRNPLKLLAARKDLKQEYTEVKTGVAENELKRINIEKLSKHSNLAVEALAGLASKEDFTAVSLRKPTIQSSAPMLPYKNLMLLLIKGRRHVQTRLVEPTYHSINKGDCYVLVTPNEVFLWLGEFSNVIERSRSSEVAAHIAQTKDLGCINANNVITITDGKPSIHAEKFWTLLGASKNDINKLEVTNAGHLDEDEIYEISLIGTNMIYEVEGDELVPNEKFWGNVPKIEMLDANKIFVFDFGTELYVWNGKNASMEQRKVASKLAQELWDEGYNYSDCDISPINASLNLGSRNQQTDNTKKSGSARPPFSLIGKVTQHMETILFREKFLDWPDFKRVIRTKSQEDDEKQKVANLDLKPCDVKEMQEWKQPEPDFILEGSHLGRGTEFFEEETRRFFAIKTTNVSMWRIEEFESAKLEKSSVGQFYSGDSYIIQWLYTVSVTGRELNGNPSKHNVSGRDRCAYFCWQGRDAALNEQGAAALLTVELDKEGGPQVRLIQGYEPPAFWNLFGGSAVIHRGKRSEPIKKNIWRLYMVRGELENEAVLTEVICNIKHLRSRGSFILINPQKNLVFIWHGSKSSKKTKKCCNSIINNLKLKKASEFGLNSDADISTKEFIEGQETQEFFDGLGGNNRHLYHSLSNESDAEDFSSMHLFHLSSMLGVFQADPIISHSGSFLQQDLYSASQPALFLLDTSKELWLWQGWWPVDGDPLDPENDGIIEETGSSQRGAVAIRWQAERRAAMETALNYWKNQHPTESPKAKLVWAGLEPTEFTNLFPEWSDRDDVAELNIRDGRKPCEILSVERELMRLTKSTYPPEVLLQRPLPEGVDPTRLELYLEPKHFKELLGVTKEEFLELPLWKQTKTKKDACLF